MTTKTTEEKFRSSKLASAQTLTKAFFECYPLSELDREDEDVGGGRIPN